MATNKGLNRLKQYYGDITEEKRKSMKEAITEILKTIDGLYPYDFDHDGVRRKNPVLDTKDHFLYCVKEYEDFVKVTLSDDFVNRLYEVVFDRFYAPDGDNYHKVLAFFRYMTTNKSTKKKEDHELFIELYDNFKIDAMPY